MVINTIYIPVLGLDGMLPSTNEYYPTNTNVQHNWQLTSIKPLPTPGVTQKDFSHYIHHPYSNPDLIEENKRMDLYNKKLKIEALQSENPGMSEYHDNMAAICANFYRAKRMKNFRVMDQHVYHRRIMSFKRFAEDCEDYENNNRLIWSGLNTTD